MTAYEMVVRTYSHWSFSTLELYSILTYLLHGAESFL